VNSLAAGAYTATVTDAGGCSATQSFTITQPTALAATVTTSPVTCAGGTGSASIVASGAAIKGLIVKGASSQTANLVEFQTSAGTVISKVDAAGEIYTSDKKLVPIVYASSRPSSVPAGTIWIDSTSNVAQLTTSSGVPSGGNTNQILSKNSTNDYDTSWVDTLDPILVLMGGVV
jgi:hypothetical protein